MKNELKELQDGLNLSMDEVVQTVRTLYPKFDKPLLSKCKATEKYGIILAQDAMDRLYDRFLPKEEPQKPDAPSKQKTRHGQHRLNCRISCRLPDTDYQKCNFRTSIRHNNSIFIFYPICSKLFMNGIWIIFQTVNILDG